VALPGTLAGTRCPCVRPCTVERGRHALVPDADDQWVRGAMLDVVFAADLPATDSRQPVDAAYRLDPRSTWTPRCSSDRTRWIRRTDGGFRRGNSCQFAALRYAVATIALVCRGQSSDNSTSSYAHVTDIGGESTRKFPAFGRALAARGAGMVFSHPISMLARHHLRLRNRGGIIPGDFLIRARWRDWAHVPCVPERHAWIDGRQIASGWMPCAARRAVFHREHCEEKRKGPPERDRAAVEILRLPGIHRR